VGGFEEWLYPQNGRYILDKRNHEYATGESSICRPVSSDEPRVSVNYVSIEEFRLQFTPRGNTSQDAVNAKARDLATFLCNSKGPINSVQETTGLWATFDVKCW